MIVIDGADGEGGGQVLRSALGLSMATGQPFRIENIRAGRAKPGLLRQHLTAVRAAEEISGAEVTGASGSDVTLGARELTFQPGKVHPGRYRFAVGTAGSATLVLQAVLPALMLAAGPSELTLEGGTHNQSAPPFDFLDQAFFPVLRRLGVGISAKLHRPGFYPAGGGRFVVEIEPAGRLAPVHLKTRGELKRRRAVAVVSNLDPSIAERELKTLAEELDLEASELEVVEQKRAHGPGNVLMLTLAFEKVTEVFTGFGQKGVSARDVALRTAAEAQAYLNCEAAVGEHLADQLLLPFALAGGGSFTTASPSLHTRTNAEVIGRFLNVEFTGLEAEKGSRLVTVYRT